MTRGKKIEREKCYKDYFMQRNNQKGAEKNGRTKILVKAPRKTRGKKKHKEYLMRENI